MIEARRSLQWLFWDKSTRKEKQTMYDNDTVELVDPPPDQQVLSNIV